MRLKLEAIPDEIIEHTAVYTEELIHGTDSNLEDIMDSNINLTCRRASTYVVAGCVLDTPGLDQLPYNPEADLKSFLNPAMVVEDIVPKLTSEQWEDLTQLLDKFQGIFSQNKWDVGCINLEPQRPSQTFL
ncbi:hypothetical protein TNCV_3358861 [Trichonephila clavipes]|nr:hypothetical protein TNCV_3358861 [Trichonephila clavipes]